MADNANHLSSYLRSNTRDSAPFFHSISGTKWMFKILASAKIKTGEQQHEEHCCNFNNFLASKQRIELLTFTCFFWQTIQIPSNNTRYRNNPSESRHNKSFGNEFACEVDIILFVHELNVYGIELRPFTVQMCKTHERNAEKKKATTSTATAWNWNICIFMWCCCYIGVRVYTTATTKPYVVGKRFINISVFVFFFYIHYSLIRVNEFVTMTKTTFHTQFVCRCRSGLISFQSIFYVMCILISSSVQIEAINFHLNLMQPNYPL